MVEPLQDHRRRARLQKGRCDRGQSEGFRGPEVVPPTVAALPAPATSPRTSRVPE
jgi:hypothetical protein